MKNKNCILVLVIAFAMVTLLSGFTDYDGLGTVSYESEQQIGPGTSYSYLVSSNTAANGIVSAHVINADVVSGKVKPYVYNGLVRKTYTVSSMANIIANEGYKVVAGINGDIYDTASGTPKGAVIHDGILYTGGYQSGYLLSFDKEGNASVSNQKISYSMSYKKYADKENSDLTEDSVSAIGYFNVPHGGSNALHVFNSKYSDSTKTTGTCAEAVLTVDSGSNNDLKIGKSVSAVVTSVNCDTNNTKINDNQLVVSANNKSASYNDVCNMVPGTVVTIKVSTDEKSPIINADEAMGVYNVLAYDGELWTTDKTLNPRTCIGIKADGSIVLFVVDGRQSSVSKGMNAVDVAKYLMSIGCVTVVNMDGGGSTTMVARDEPGKSDVASLVNSPSDKNTRSVTNGLFFTYTTVAEKTATKLAVYPENTLIVPGMSVQLAAYGVNDLYEKSTLSQGITYSVDSSMGTVDSSGVFTASKDAFGEAVITAASGDITGSAKVTIVRDITFGLNKVSAEMEAGSTYDFNVTSVKHGNSSVQYRDDLFTWSCSAEIGTIDKNGLFKATDEYGEFSGNITVSCGNKTATIPVKIKYSSPFSDIKGHWARDYIISLYEKGIINGMTKTTFEPNSNLTRAQFLNLLLNLDGNEQDAETGSVSFKDVNKNLWYYECICWGVNNGIAKGIGDNLFAPNSKVSREQMCVMICNYYNYKKMEWEREETNLSFKDKSKISSWATSSVKRVVSEKIMSGRTDGTFDPSGNATRGEAAKIIFLVEGIMKFQNAD